MRTRCIINVIIFNHSLCVVRYMYMYVCILYIRRFKLPIVSIYLFFSSPINCIRMTSLQVNSIPYLIIKYRILSYSMQNKF